MSAVKEGIHYLHLISPLIAVQDPVLIQAPQSIFTSISG